ncbi:MAG: anhydro-N-acetylmuramic acid kinase [Acetobacteraceae bacterium]|jgi:anhydro-N-acetylmuramic acid kinase
MPRTIGLMSGTSLDGVDAAWLETDGETIMSVGPSLTIPYDDSLRRDLRAILDTAHQLPTTDPGLASAVARLTECHVRAVKALERPADLIGFHGQTILHQPDQRRTWQVGDAAHLARETGVPVAYDFRSADVAAGGEGAPFAPAYHAALARDLPRPLAVLNVGGVANVTWIGPRGIDPRGIDPRGIGPRGIGWSGTGPSRIASSGTGEDEGLIAFDTGPGNGPLDDWVARHTGQAFDRHGALALSGTVDAAVLGRLMAHPYFARPAPKSLDRLDFSRALAVSGLDALTAADGAATLVAFTAASVAAAVFPSPPLRWLVTGGGRHNPAIMTALRAALGVPVEAVETVGWDGDALEAQCFGFLAARVARGLPLSFRGTTGVPAPMPGGRIVTA